MSRFDDTDHAWRTRTVGAVEATRGRCGDRELAVGGYVVFRGGQLGLVTGLAVRGREVYVLRVEQVVAGGDGRPVPHEVEAPRGQVVASVGPESLAVAEYTHWWGRAFETFRVARRQVGVVARNRREADLWLRGVGLAANAPGVAGYVYLTERRQVVGRDRNMVVFVPRSLWALPDPEGRGVHVEREARGAAGVVAELRVPGRPLTVCAPTLDDLGLWTRAA